MSKQKDNMPQQLLQIARRATVVELFLSNQLLKQEQQNNI